MIISHRALLHTDFTWTTWLNFGKCLSVEFCQRKWYTELDRKHTHSNYLYWIYSTLMMSLIFGRLNKLHSHQYNIFIVYKAYLPSHNFQLHIPPCAVRYSFRIYTTLHVYMIIISAYFVCVICFLLHTRAQKS